MELIEALNILGVDKINLNEINTIEVDKITSIVLEKAAEIRKNNCLNFPNLVGFKYTQKQANILLAEIEKLENEIFEYRTEINNRTRKNT